MEGPPLGPGGEDITWPDQVAPRGRKASSTRKIKPQTSNHGHLALVHQFARPVYFVCGVRGHLALVHRWAPPMCSWCGVNGPLALAQ